MVISFFKIRTAQIFRIMAGVGWPYRLALLLLVAGILAGIYTQASQTESSQALLSIYVLSLSLLHWFRADFTFLRTCISDYKKIIFLEYLILSLPLMAGLVVSIQSYLIMSYLVFLLGLAYLITPKKIIVQNARSLNFIPDQYFEWKSSIRRYFYPIVGLWLLGLLFSFQMGVGIVAIFLIGLLTLACYEYCEPLEILTATQLNSKQFIKQRVKGLLLMSSLLFVPILISFCLFHPEFWYIPMIEVSLLVSYLGYALMIKYAFYEPHTQSSKNKILIFLGALALVLPFLLPAIWLLSIKLYFQSLTKLDFYLNDFN